MLAALAALGAVAFGAAFAIQAHLFFHAGRIAAHAEMLDAATQYHVTRRITEADTKPSILALLDATHPLPAVPPSLPPQASTVQAKRDAAQQPSFHSTATLRRA